MPQGPRVAIPEPTSTDVSYNERSLPQYVHSLEAAGAMAVPISLSETPARQELLLASCAAILLPGSPADVDPAKYGQERQLVTAICNVGHARAGLGHYRPALRVLTAALRLAPRTDNRLTEANVLHSLGRHDEAVVSYRRALAIRDDLADVHLNLSAVLQLQGELGEALAHADRAVTLAPMAVSAHNNRGVILHAVQRYEEAIESYQRVLALDPGHAGTHVMAPPLCRRVKGQILHEQGAGTHQAHVAAQHVPELRQLVEARRPEELAETRDSRAVWQRLPRSVARVAHGSEFHQSKGPCTQSGALLHEENRRPETRFYGNRQSQQ